MTSPPATPTSTVLARRAPLDGVVEQVGDRALEAARHAVDERRRCRSRPEVDLGASRRGAGRRRRGPARRAGPRSSRGRAARSLASSTRLETSRLISSSWTDDVASRASRASGPRSRRPREHLDVRAEARQRACGARARRPRRAGAGRAGTRSSAREHRVEARAEPRQLVVAVHLDPLPEVLRLGHELRLTRQPPHRRHGGARDERADQRRDDDAAQRDEDQDESGSGRAASRPRRAAARSGGRTLGRPARSWTHRCVSSTRASAKNGSLALGRGHARVVSPGTPPAAVRRRDRRRRARPPARRRRPASRPPGTASRADRCAGRPADAERARGHERSRARAASSSTCPRSWLANEHVDERGGERRSHGDGRPRHHREPEPEAHDSRSA